MSAAATASLIDGRRFTFQCSLDGFELQPGSYAAIGDGYLGQVHTVEEATVEGADGTSLARGHGVILDGDARPFHDLAAKRASAASIASWLARARPARATLDVGALLLEPEVRFSLDPGGPDRHTFLCGQSGSGKTYALGTILERLLLETAIRIVVLDPNSDFVRLAEVREGIDESVTAAYRRAAAGIVVRKAGTVGSDRLHVRFTDFDADERAAVHRLDPIRDRDEFGALLDTLETGLGDERAVPSLVDRLLAASSPELHAQCWW